ncbi:MAG: hypothetical protein DRR19_23815 [Candidatus Parabeggiatoa sp. nov. 1]|nr:MAG: hypothetical protein DRR19_23815 [Gammaproteobacteria bacterium]
MLTLEEQQHRNALPQGFWLNEYQIESVLGKPGGFGITYLATDTHLRQSVAIKEYLPTDFAIREGISTVYVRSSSYDESFQWGLKCFIEESRVLAKFNHPYIVRVLRFFEANGTAYMVMEYQKGRSLTDYLKQQRILVEDQLLAIVHPLLDGLREIHKAGFLHRDIKPNNIYIREDNTPVLLDFGSARYAVGQKTRSVTSIVTPGYAPLEQYDNNINDQGPWTDLYALGAVMYCAISGEAPPAATRRVMKDPMVPAVKVGKGKYNKNLLQAIDWALRLSEEDRPQTVEQWQDKMLVPTLPTSSSTERLYQSRCSFVNVASMVVILLLGAACAVLFYKNQTHNVEITTERSARQIAEQQLEIERKLRQKAEQDYFQVKASIEEVQRFEPQAVAKIDHSNEADKYYDIVNVEVDDFLNVREFPGHLNKPMGSIPQTEKCIKYLGNLRFVKGQVWVKVQYKEAHGWVNSYYLMGSERCDEEKKN